MEAAQLERLKGRDYVVVIDRSGSMEEHDGPNGQSRWKAAQESTQMIANRCNEYDPDGISVYTFNSSFQKEENTTPDKVKEVFAKVSPNGGTALVPVLSDIFNGYTRDKKAGTSKPNGMMVIVITDGEPSDEGATAKLIANFTKNLESREEFGLEFFQVGKCPTAQKFLKRLDDNLTSEGAKFDIVNTKTFDELETMNLEDALIDALTH